MKKLFFICLLFSKITYGAEVLGEWSRCDLNKGSIILYTSIFTKNYRYEITLFGKGKMCTDIYKKANFGAIIVSKISQNKENIIHQRLSTSFVAFDEESRLVIGSPKSCNLDRWFTNYDKSCFLDGNIIPEFKEALLQEISRKNFSAVKIYKYKALLIEDVWPELGLYSTNDYLIKNFE